MNQVKKCMAVLVVCASALILVSCKTTPAPVTPPSSEEAAVMKVLADWESTWNNHNIEGNLALWNANAKIMYGKDRKLASKQEYREIIEGRMAANPEVSLGKPKVNLSGDKAEASVDLVIGSYSSICKFYLVKENGNWSIMSWNY